MHACVYTQMYYFQLWKRFKIVKNFFFKFGSNSWWYLLYVGITWQDVLIFDKHWNQEFLLLVCTISGKNEQVRRPAPQWNTSQRWGWAEVEVGYYFLYAWWKLFGLETCRCERWQLALGQLLMARSRGAEPRRVWESKCPRCLQRVEPACVARQF